MSHFLLQYIILYLGSIMRVINVEIHAACTLSDGKHNNNMSYILGDAVYRTGPLVRNGNISLRLVNLLFELEGVCPTLTSA